MSLFSRTLRVSRPYMTLALAPGAKAPATTMRGIFSWMVLAKAASA